MKKSLKKLCTFCHWHILDFVRDLTQILKRVLQFSMLNLITLILQRRNSGSGPLVCTVASQQSPRLRSPLAWGHPSSRYTSLLPSPETDMQRCAFSGDSDGLSHEWEWMSRMLPDQSDIKSQENMEGVFSISLHFWFFHSPLESVSPVVTCWPKANVFLWSFVFVTRIVPALNSLKRFDH